PTAHIPFLAWPLDYAGLSFGEHQIYVRVKDEYGRWSLYARDTIFHYIDTLPTASLSGPVGVCIHDTASFQVYMTGTGPWTLSYFDGFTNHTVSGISQAYYSFNVIPDSAGHFTARILQVSDVYYTGLYTGIPIEYDVFPMPEDALAIIGPTDLCASAATAYFSITSVANTDVYHWTVPPGATIVSTGYHWWSGPWIYVDFHGTPQSGTITVTPQNACGSGVSSSMNVTVHPNPVVDAGVDQVVDFGDTAQVSATAFGGTPPYTYSWSPWWAFGNYTDSATSVYLGSTATISVTISDHYGCQASDNVTIYVGPQDGATISGFLTYDNAASSPIPSSSVYLNQLTPADTSLTGSGGEYSFMDVSTGWYNLSASSRRPWGGVNAADGLLIMKHFVDSLTLTGLRAGAADVNASNYVNAVDALMCNRRFTGLDTSFASGDWLFESPSFYTIGIGTGSVNLKGICYGDVDGSFIPGKQVPASVDLMESGSLKIAANRAEIPVVVRNAYSVGAVSLVLHVPAGFRIENIRMASGDQASLVYNLRGDELRIAWFSMEPMVLKAGEPLLFVDVSWMMTPHTPWRIGSESSLADEDARIIDAAELSIPKLLSAEPEFALGYNYPNPFRGQTVIPYTLPSSGTVKISLLNLLGEVVAEIFEGNQSAGSYELLYDAGKIAPGVYHYRLVAQTVLHRYELSRMMVIAN
ncbi:MAG: T9SS type A sorting domain-containing protein, partial [Bacteroidales bacterium]|nr:T9SS type A sorting domain-containing protein [Bacteroidales bacterium]